MHIAFVLPGIDCVGGAERQAMLLAEYIVKRGHQATVVTLSGAGGEQAGQLRAQGVSYLSLQMRKGLLDPVGWLRWARFVHRESPDVVHSHLPHATWLTRWSRLWAPVPVQLDTLHTTATGDLGRKLGYRWSNWLSDDINAVSEDVAQAYSKGALIEPRRCRSVIPNAVDLRRWRTAADLNISTEASSRASFQWIAIGRLEPVKNYSLLLRALKLLPERAELAIAGSGSQQQMLEQLVQDLGLQNRVRFLGHVADLRSYLYAADAMVLASQWEGLPTVVLEAGACGLPAVATNVPGTRCAVVDGVTGFLVDPDDPIALAQGMNRLMDLSQAENRALGMNAHAHVAAEFDVERVVDRWEALYRELLDRSRFPKRWPVGLRRLTKSAADENARQT